MAEVPFPDAGRRIAARLQGAGDGDLALRQPPGRVREEDAPRVAAHPAPDRQAPCQQGGPAGRTDRCAHIEVGPPLALGRHAVDVRCPDARVSVAAEIAIPQVVAEDDDEARLPGGPLGREEWRARQAVRERHAGQAHPDPSRDIASRPRALHIGLPHRDRRPHAICWVPTRRRRIRVFRALLVLLAHRVAGSNLAATTMVLRTARQQQHGLRR